jgi:DMSO/TMAO reductase YedYZ molybdopterin-dependent catalytic subunit
VYRGVSLKKVLKYAAGGILPECQHVEFIGADTYFKKGHVFNYAVSVPYRKVRAREEVLLAWEMNGAPLPKIHGGPLRTVVTGFIGARSCKWVYKINCLKEPSMGPVQRQEYLYYSARRPTPPGPRTTDPPQTSRWASRTCSTRTGSASRRCPSRTCTPRSVPALRADRGPGPRS